MHRAPAIQCGRCGFRSLEIVRVAREIRPIERRRFRDVIELIVQSLGGAAVSDGTSGCRAEFSPNFPKFVFKVSRFFGRERAFADPCSIGLYDADYMVNYPGAYTTTDSDST